MENSGSNRSLKDILKRLIIHHNVIKQEDGADVKLISMKRIGYFAITEFFRIFGEDVEDYNRLHIQAIDLLQETYLSEDPVLKENIDVLQEIFETTTYNEVGWIAAWFIYFGPVPLDDDNYFEIFTDEAIAYGDSGHVDAWEDILPSMHIFLEDNPIPVDGTYEEKYMHLHKWLGDLSDSEFVNYDDLMRATLIGHRNAVEHYQVNS